MNTIFKRLLKNPKIVFVGVLSQFFLLPACTFLAILLIKPHPSFALGMMLIAACPGGNVSNFFSKMAGGNAALSVSLTAFSTLICIVMTPFNLQFWGSLYEPTHEILKTVELNWVDLLKLVSLILGIPLFFGMLIKQYHSEMAKKIEKLLKPLSMLVFIALIFIAFSQNLDVFVNHIHHVIYLVIFHNIFAFIIGFYTAKTFGLNAQDTKTISIETGIQNGPLAIAVLVAVFIDNPNLDEILLIPALYALCIVIISTLVTFWFRRANVAEEQKIPNLL
jgi:BASS family bile acid:Na+ symporter